MRTRFHALAASLLREFVMAAEGLAVGICLGLFHERIPGTSREVSR